MHFIENNFWHTQCPACGSQSIKEVGKQALNSHELYSNFPIVQLQRPEIWVCLGCKSMFKQNSVKEADSVLLYSEGNAVSRWSSDERFGKTFFNRKSRVFRKKLVDILLKSQAVLDIGCNDGLFLDDAKNFCLKTSGVEYSHEARTLCSAKGHQVFKSLDEVDSRFDLITAFDLVEHLYNITEFFVKCKELLAPGGRIVILTGNPECIMARAARQDWWYASFPEHLIFPSLLYFSMIEGLRLEGYCGVRHARQGFKLPIGLARALVTGCCKWKFNGLSGLWPDHHVIVLSLVA